MKTVEKKIRPEYFKDIVSRHKTFELRRDEDDVQVGDFLKLREWDGEEYTGNYVYRYVSYVLRGYEGLQPGYAIYGLKIGRPLPPLDEGNFADQDTLMSAT